MTPFHDKFQISNPKMSTQPEPDAVECEETLSKKYHKLWLAARNLENVYGQDLQKQINQLLPEFLIMQKIVDELDMFSLNENIDDLTLSTIPFILCDAITGILYSSGSLRETKLGYKRDIYKRDSPLDLRGPFRTYIKIKKNQNFSKCFPLKTKLSEMV